MAIIDAGKIVALGSPSELKRVIGGDMVVIKIATPNIKEIEKLQYIKKVEIKNNLVYLTVINASQHLAQIMQVIGKVESVEIHPPTLNDVFLHYTGKEIRAQAAEGGWADRVIHHQSNT